MKCTNCGAELPPDADSCMECGAQRPEEPPSSKSSPWKWVAVGCIGLLAVALIVAGLSGFWLLGLLFQSQELTITLPGLPGGEPTTTPRPTPTWLPAPPPTPTWLPASPTIGPAPTIEPAVVNPYCSAFDHSPLYVRENQPVTIYWGWLATTSSYVQDFLDTATIEVFLDGEEVRPDTQSEVEYDSEDGGYTVGWSANVGPLTPGSHRLDYHVSWSRQISDGWHTYGPGGEYEEEHEYCELTVE